MIDFQSKKLVIFDLDGTLTPSKSSIQSDMSELLVKLLKHKKVAIISGGKYEQFEKRLLEKLPETGEIFNNLILVPTSGASLYVYVWGGKWELVYEESLTPGEKMRIKNALDSALSRYYKKPKETFGEIIEDRGSQITFSALGQEAPLELKSKWDPTHEKRKIIVEDLKKNLPEFDIRIGGTTSIDITRAGVDKEYGINKLKKYFNLTPEDMLFVGDALYPEGNDYPATKTGVECLAVSGPKETKKLIEGWLNTKP